jgi:hypothetical protein
MAGQPMTKIEEEISDALASQTITAEELGHLLAKVSDEANRAAIEAKTLADRALDPQPM